MNISNYSKHIKFILFFIFFNTLLFSNEASILQKEKNSTINHIKLTPEEILFLKDKKEITMCIDPNWMPFEKNKNGKHIGMTADYFEIIQKKLNIKIRLINTQNWMQSLKYGETRKCDIFSLIMPTEQRDKYLNYTKPYLEIPLVLSTKTDEIFVNDITKVTKKMAITKDYAYGQIIRNKYKNLNLVEVDTILEGLSKVDSGEIYGLIGSLPTIGYNIQQNYIGQLKIAGKFNENWTLGIGVRNDLPILIPIFNKAIISISEKTHQRILNKWLSVTYDKVTYKYFFETISISLLIIFIILFINRRLSQEIKKRKEIESYLNLIIKGAGLGTWTWNPKTGKNIINQRWADIIGYTKEEVDKVGNHLFFIIEEDKENLKKSLNKHIDGKTESYETEFRMKAKDGSIKWIYSNGSVVQRDENNNPTLIAGIHQDITEEKRLEEELKKQNTFILQQSRQAAMGEMLENIAHQWRQPLTVITISASGIKLQNEIGTLNDDVLLEYMNQILKSSNYLSNTIEDFRNFFKNDKIYKTFNIEELFNKSLQFLQSKIINKNIYIIKKIEDETIYSYENELIQVFINIFNNAVDALDSCPDEKYILITQTSDDEFYTINIQDNAKGIDKNIIHKIFDPYFTTKHQSQGTGIGLHMTREIIVKHLKGTIEVSNSTFTIKNKTYIGANFTIKLPK